MLVPFTAHHLFLHLLFMFPFYRWRNYSLVRWNDLIQTQKAVRRVVTMMWSLDSQLLSVLL